jgi:uncharacterized protein (TIGR02466 family)
VLLTSPGGLFAFLPNVAQYMKELIRLNLQRIFFMCAYRPNAMSSGQSKQITVRFDLKDWIQVLQEAESEGIKPVQFIRSTILKRLNGTLEIKRPFGPIIAKVRVSKELLTVLLTKAREVRATKSKENDYRNRLSGNLSEEYSYTGVLTEEEESLLSNEILGAANSYTLTAAALLKRDVSILKESMRIDVPWVNFMKAGEWNPRHYHTGVLSVVIFLKVPKEIALENYKEDSVKKSLQPTAGMLQFSYGEQCEFSSSTKNIIPVAGDMYLFPSSLHHQVYPFISDTERISVSMNIDRK